MVPKFTKIDRYFIVFCPHNACKAQYWALKDTEVLPHDLQKQFWHWDNSWALIISTDASETRTWVSSRKKSLPATPSYWCQSCDLERFSDSDSIKLDWNSCTPAQSIRDDAHSRSAFIVQSFLLWYGLRPLRNGHRKDRGRGRSKKKMPDNQYFLFSISLI